MESQNIRLDPRRDSQYPDFVDGIATKAEADSCRREEIMEAVRYGSYSDAWLLQSKTAERRQQEDSLTIKKRRLEDLEIEHLDPQSAWKEIVKKAEERIKKEGAWVADIRSIMSLSIGRCATTDEDDLYDRLEELHHVISEISRHEVDRKEWQSHAERVVVRLPQREQEAALRQVEIIRYTLRINHEAAHEVRRGLEKPIVDRGIHFKLIDLPYKNLSEEMSIYPRQGCESYLKALQEAASAHRVRERGETIPEHQMADIEHAQAEAIVSTDGQTKALSATQLQNNWLLAEIRKKLRPDGRKLAFETETKTYQIVEKVEEQEDLPQFKGGNWDRREMVYSPMEEELPKKYLRPRRWWWCC